MSTVADHPVMTPPSRLYLPLELRAFAELGGLVAGLPLLLARVPRGDGHPVLVLPGLIAGDALTLPLRSFLNGRGYAAVGWELGPNLGPREGVEERMLELLERLHRTHGRKVSLVGWSLGGVYARQLAKARPESVRQVITLGSPFNGDPRVATNAWRLYEYASGRKVDERDGHIGGAIAPAPPVPATAVYSRSDGICAWRSCIEEDGPLTDNIEVRASHCGLAHHPACVFAIADRLAQPEDGWRKFDRSGWRAAFFPDPARN